MTATRLALTGAVVAGVALAAGATAEAPTQAERLAALRGEVELLSQAVATEKATTAERVRSLETQRADLELELRREETRKRQLEEQAERARTEVAEASEASSVLLPVVLDGIEQLQSRIDAGLPYRIAERQQALAQVKAQVEAGTIRPEVASSRLWQSTEDELRLARENTIDRQLIELDGHEVLVEVARVGMVALYFRTEDGRTGWAEQTDGGWTWREASSPLHKERVASLFDALDKQIRAGSFQLPGASLGVEG